MKKKILILGVVIVIAIVVGIVFAQRNINKKEISNNDTENSINDDNTNDIKEDKREITEEEAKEKLSEIDYNILELPTNITEYNLIMTNEEVVEGINCYVFGAFSDLGDRQYNMGTFAVSKDGNNIYIIKNGEWSKIEE